jgi:hypothetical protein
VACRGQISEKPPIHPNQNMDQQERFDPQEPNPWFADGRAMRPRVDGTLPYGAMLIEAPQWNHYYLGCRPDVPADRCDQRPEAEVSPVDAVRLPRVYGDGSSLVMDRPFLRRGQERYEIYCTPCHDSAGSGQGIVATRSRGRLNPRNLLEDPVMAMPIGYLYRVISDGKGVMGPYRYQIPPDDRWRIAAYLRALQLAQAEGVDDESSNDDAGAEPSLELDGE